MFVKYSSFSNPFFLNILEFIRILLDFAKKLVSVFEQAVWKYFLPPTYIICLTSFCNCTTSLPSHLYRVHDAIMPHLQYESRLRRLAHFFTNPSACETSETGLETIADYYRNYNAMQLPRCYLTRRHVHHCQFVARGVA